MLRARGQAQLYTPVGNGFGISIPSTLLETLSRHSFRGHEISPDVVVHQSMLAAAKLARHRDRQFEGAASRLATSALKPQSTGDLTPARRARPFHKHLRALSGPGAHYT